MQIYNIFKEAIQAGKLVALATVITGRDIGEKLLIWPDGTTAGSLGSELDAPIEARAKTLLRVQKSERITVVVEDKITGGKTGVDVFVDVHAPPPKLVVVGAVHIAIHLVTFANSLGYRTMVVDARSAFATPERFPHADDLIVQWPADALAEIGIDESTCVVVLTHDEKLDNPALQFAIAQPARYIGALGSKKTHARRVESLRAMGADEETLARIHAPIGLNLGGRRPEEIAISIIAEIVSVTNQR